MKKLISILSLFAALALSASAQTSLTGTTLASAVTSNSSQTVVLTSATGVVANQTLLFVDKEAMFVNAVNGTTIKVFRGYQGTPVAHHLSGAGVLLGPAAAFNPIPFGVNAAGDPSGMCTPGNTLYTPYVNTKNGNQWLCSTLTNQWVPGWGNNSAPAGTTAAVASVAGATLPSGRLFHITGTNTITSWTNPLGFDPKSGNSFCVVPDGAYQTTAGNNIGTTTTATANRAQCWTYEPNAAKWYASY
ncbi:MAG TPA: hypothetical protein VHX11_08920 [Acidobacteriaceae bacterium]|jgi:hypothetical protein|nr:hypothetical protein [Acidobacteriaceae bacterium]